MFTEFVADERLLSQIIGELVLLLYPIKQNFGNTGELHWKICKEYKY